MPAGIGERRLVKLCLRMSPQPTPLEELVLRAILPEDSPAAARLSEELGYPASAEQMKQRIRSLAKDPDRAVFVACIGDRMVGWIDVGATRHLQSDPYAEIGGLVVDGTVRSAGIGRRLVALAETWASERGYQKMVVRSRSTRQAAHRFYLREGYELTKTSAVFSKQLT